MNAFYVNQTTAEYKAKVRDEDYLGKRALMMENRVERAIHDGALSAISYIALESIYWKRVVFDLFDEDMESSRHRSPTKHGARREHPAGLHRWVLMRTVKKGNLSNLASLDRMRGWL